MEKFIEKNIEVASTIFLCIIVGIFAYMFGEAVGRDNTKSMYLNSSYISSCNNEGDYCYLNTEDGDKEISCNEGYKCSITPNTIETIQMEERVKEILKKIKNE